MSLLNRRTVESEGAYGKAHHGPDYFWEGWCPVQSSSAALLAYLDLAPWTLDGEWSCLVSQPKPYSDHQTNKTSTGEDSEA